MDSFHPAAEDTNGDDGVCKSQTNTGFQPCSAIRYSCQIYSGPTSPTGVSLPPTEDAFIEWHWAVSYGTNFITGKFTFCASASYILSRWTAYGGSYLKPSSAPFNYGIPMFNPSNHNVS